MELPSFETHGPDLAVIEHMHACGEILASQMPTSSEWSPEKKLAAAVLASALSEIRERHGDRSYRRRVTEDLQWVFSDDLEWPFSFLRLCEVFALDPDYVRAQVKRWMAIPREDSRRQLSVHRYAA
jgi:hypothetical protein